MARTRPRHPLSRPEVVGLCRRFVKEGSYQPKVDPILFYKAFALFPDRAFWLAYELGFQLNSIAWFLSAEGQEKLAQDLAVFRLDLSAPTSPTLETAKVGTDSPISRPKRTVADLFS